MSIVLDEAAYARALRASARETARRWRGGAFHMQGHRGGLTDAVLDALADGPITSGAIARRIGRDVTDIPVILRRLEADGRAERTGTTRNDTGQVVNLWGRPRK